LVDAGTFPAGGAVEYPRLPGLAEAEWLAERLLPRCLAVVLHFVVTHLEVRYRDWCTIQGALLMGDFGMTAEDTTVPVPGPGTTQGRRFGIYDAMISIGGMAILLTYGGKDFSSLLQQLTGLCRAIAAYCGLVSARPSGPPQLLMRYMADYWGGVLWYGVQASELLVLIMTPVFLLMRVRRPGAPIRAMLRQPGTVAGLAVTFGYFWVTGWLHRLFFGRINFQLGTAVAVGGTVAVAWAFLAVSRQWETEPSWVDRMGRLIGATAIAVGLLAFTQFGI